MITDYFLDTSVFVTGTDNSEKYFAAANKILIQNSFSTSYLVKYELDHIAEVRNRVYTILTTDRIIVYKSLAELKEGILSEFKESKNVKNFILRYFNRLVDALRFDENKPLTNQDYPKIKEESYFVLRNHRNRLDAIIKNLNNSAYRKQHVPFIDTHDSNYQTLQSDLKKILKPHNTESIDLQILAHAIFNAYEDYRVYTFVSNDHFHTSNKEKVMKLIGDKFHSHELKVFPAVSRITIEPLSAMD